MKKPKKRRTKNGKKQVRMPVLWIDEEVYTDYEAEFGGYGDHQGAANAVYSHASLGHKYRKKLLNRHFDELEGNNED